MLKIITKKFLNFLHNVKTEGNISNLSQERTLIIANHSSFLDGILLNLYLPIKPTFLIHSTVKNNPLFKYLIKFANTYEIDTQNPYSIKHIIKLLETGTPIVIFPEGRITNTNGLMKIYPGAAFAAAKANATIVPISISGANFTKLSRLNNILPTKYFQDITLKIHDTFDLQIPNEGTSREKRNFLGEEMRKKLQLALSNTQKPQSLFEAFLLGKNTYGKKTHIIEDIKRLNQPYNYQEIFKAIQGLRVISQKIISKEEKRVGIFLPNLMITIASIYALNAEKKVPCMLNYTSGLDSILHTIRISNISTIITSRAFLEMKKLTPIIDKISEILTQEGKKFKIIYVEDLKSLITIKDKIKIASYMIFNPFEQQDENDEAIILYTSGSEGKPKGVVHTNKSIISNVWQIRSIIDSSPKDKILMSLPLFHSFGMNAGNVFPLCSGIPMMLYHNPLDYKTIPELGYDRNCTIIFSTNTFLSNYAKQAHNYDFFRYRYVIAGAEKLSDQTREIYFDKFGIRILEGYGLTETAPVLSVNTPMAYKKGSVGQLLPGINYYLEKVEGIEEGGALYVSCQNLMKGYLLNSDGISYVNDIPSNNLYKTNIQDDLKNYTWFKTGDIVEIDQEGFVFIKGRMKRFAKVAGEMVSLETTESIAKLSSPKFESAAINTPDEKKGEVIILFTTDKNLSRDILVSKCKELGHSELAIPKTIKFIEKIPLLGTGKTDYVTLKTMI